MIDSTGFATQAWQMDSIMNRIEREFKVELKNIQGHYDTSVQWKVAISPHDDYTYASYLYPAVIRNIKAKHIFMIGVFHKAKVFDINNQLIFGNYKAWAGPYGNTMISPLRDEILKALPDSIRVVKDTIMAVEHSLEALLPFIQYYNRDAQIIPMLVPYANLDNMERFSDMLANQIHRIAEKKNWVWGEDFAILISNDAVHYGDEGWGGNDFARYGTDIEGYRMAVEHEMEIIDSCLTGELSNGKVRKFINYTVDKDDYMQYKWTWCGRYSIPCGLFLADHLQEIYAADGKLHGNLIGYANSIDHPKLHVEDLGMGATAPANDHHWVGYTAIGYK